MAKTFDIVLNSKYNPAGVTEAQQQLEQTAQTAQQTAAQVKTVFDRLEEGGIKLMRAGQGFRQLGELFGSQSLTNIGNLVGGVGALSNSLGELAGIMGRIASIKLVGPLAFIFGAAEGARAIGTDITNRLGGATTEQWVQALQRVETALNGLSPEDKAAKLDELKRSLDGLSAADRVNSINAWAAAIQSGAGKAELFSTLGASISRTVTGIADSLQDLARRAPKPTDWIDSFRQAGQNLSSGLQAIEQQVTDFRADAATERRHLLENIAIAEGRRLQDLARANARQMQQIELTRTAALRTAAETYAATIAQIEQTSADNRARIEEAFQERLRQIKESNGDSIEDAIERRDARALAKALRSQAQQLSQAERDRDKQLAEADQTQAQQKAQAEAALKDQQAAAQAAAQAALDAMREADRLAADQQKIATDRALQDLDLAKLREQQVLIGKLQAQYKTMQTAYQQQQALYRTHLSQMTAITTEATRPTSPLAQAITQFVNDALGDVLGNLGRTYPQRGR